MTPNILEHFWEELTQNAKQDLLVTLDHQLDRAQFQQLIRQMLTVFDQHGLQPGNTILICTENEIAAIACFIAAMLDGLVPSMAASGTMPTRLAAVTDALAPALIIIDRDRYQENWIAGRAVQAVDRARAHVRQFLPFRRKMAPGQMTGIDMVAAKRAPRLPANPAEICYIIFTSGTTDTPNGVMITRANIAAQLATLNKVFQCGPESRLFNDLRHTHVDGLVQGPLLALFCGGTVIRSGGFSVQGVESWLNRIRQERATHLVTVPTMLRMIDRYAAHDDYFDAPEFRYVLSSAESLSADFWQHLERRFNIRVCNSYGMTETVSCAIYAGPGDQHIPDGRIGRPIDCEARLAPVANMDDTTGELQLKGQNISPGYWRNTARTQRSYTDDGWLRTGDLARMNTDGSYTLMGRLKTIINSGGFLIRPEEINEAMLRMTEVAEAVTISIPDQVFAEIPVTAIVLNKPTEQAALFSHARAHLEDFQIPGHFVVLDSIPRGDAGKPILSELGEIINQHLQAKPPDRKTLNTDHLTAVCALAADHFRIDPARITPEVTTEDLPEWDSFSHLTLILAAEARFDTKIATSQVAAIRSIADLAAALETQS